MTNPNANNDNLDAEDIWGQSAAAAMAAAAAEEEKDDVELDSETLAMSTNELRQRIRLLDNEIRIMRSDIQRITHESRGQRDRIQENLEKVKLNKQLPYLVGNVVEVLEPDAEDGK
jgi:26S proteasome regulatory subunit T5